MKVLVKIAPDNNINNSLARQESSSATGKHDNMIAEPKAETTIWSRIETEKKRQNLIRTKLLSGHKNGIPAPPSDFPPSPDGSKRSHSLKVSGDLPPPPLPTRAMSVPTTSSPPSPTNRSVRSRSLKSSITKTPTGEQKHSISSKSKTESPHPSREASPSSPRGQRGSILSVVSPPSTSSPTSPTHRSVRSRSLRSSITKTPIGERKHSISSKSKTKSPHPSGEASPSSPRGQRGSILSASSDLIPPRTPSMDTLEGGDKGRRRSSHLSSLTPSRASSRDSAASVFGKEVIEASKLGTTQTPVGDPSRDKGYPDSTGSQDSSIHSSANSRSLAKRNMDGLGNGRSNIPSLPLAPDLSRSVSVSPESSSHSKHGPSINENAFSNRDIQPESRTSVTSSVTMPMSFSSSGGYPSPGLSTRSRRSASRSPSGSFGRSLSATPIRENGEKPPRRKLKNQDLPNSSRDLSHRASIQSLESMDRTKNNSESQARSAMEGGEEAETTMKVPSKASQLSLGDHLSQHEKIGIDQSGRSNRTGATGATGASKHSARDRVSTSSGTPPCYNSIRVFKEEDITETESWVYLVALILLVSTTAGVSCIVLLVFGAAGNRESEEEGMQSKLAYLSEDPSVFEDPTSPQSLALNWLVKEDEAGIDLDADVVRRETRYVLAVLYYATDGESWWKEDFGFLSESHECDWTSQEDESEQGVFCDEDLNVVNLRIVSNSLRGTLPVEISALSGLLSLNLSYNRLSGTIPSLRFETLEDLNLGSNELEGSFPSTIGALASLKSLDFSSNLLSSTLPVSLGQISFLENLRIGYNNIYGTVTEKIASLGGLKDLNVTSNSLSGSIDFVQNFPLLEELDLSSNEFMGTLPFFLGGLENLKGLDFSDNQFQGSLPTSLGLLGSLAHLSGSRNALSGTFPWSNFSENNNLVEILLADNALSGSLPSDITRYASLEVVDFGRNQLSGGIPNAIGRLASLKELHLSRNRLTGQLPVGLGLLESIVSLDFSGNSLLSTIPPSIGSLNTLKQLHLNANELSGIVPAELGMLYNIERLSLHNNELVGDIEFLCAIEYMPIISADCGGNPAEIECSCCSVCVV